MIFIIMTVGNFNTWINLNSVEIRNNTGFDVYNKY